MLVTTLPLRSADHASEKLSVSTPSNGLGAETESTA
jgi:hypothetical protein